MAESAEMVVRKWHGAYRRIAFLGGGQLLVHEEQPLARLRDSARSALEEPFERLATHRLGERLEFMCGFGVWIWGACWGVG